MAIFADMLRPEKFSSTIDGMHVQKNVFESIIGTLLDIKGETK
jgi:hypothetical protein